MLIDVLTSLLWLAGMVGAFAGAAWLLVRMLEQGERLSRGADISRWGAAARTTLFPAAFLVTTGLLYFMLRRIVGDDEDPSSGFGFLVLGWLTLAVAFVGAWLIALVRVLYVKSGNAPPGGPDQRPD